MLKENKVYCIFRDIYIDFNNSYSELDAIFLNKEDALQYVKDHKNNTEICYYFIREKTFKDW